MKKKYKEIEYIYDVKTDVWNKMSAGQQKLRIESYNEFTEVYNELKSMQVVDLLDKLSQDNMRPEAERFAFRLYIEIRQNMKDKKISTFTLDKFLLRKILKDCCKMSTSKIKNFLDNHPDFQDVIYGKTKGKINYEKQTKSTNNGGSTDYYKFNKDWVDLQDVIEERNLNFAQGNILKAAWCLGSNRHAGTNYERELNKIIWFCQRELDRIRKGEI